MRKRYTVLGLSVVLALALAVPALGGPVNPVASISASVKSVANKALKKAKAAQSTANTALSTANSANSAASGAASDAKAAETEAKKAQTTANTANTTANAAKTAAATAQGTANTALSTANSANANANTRVLSSTEVIGETSPKDTTKTKSSDANCPASQPVLGGGFFTSGDTDKVTIIDNNNQLYGHGWFATGEAISGFTPNWSITAIAMCGTQ